MTTNSNPASPTAETPVDASKPASDAQIADLVAQQTDSDSDSDSEIGSSSSSKASDDSKLENPSAPVIAPVADPDTTNEVERSTKTVNLITDLFTPEIALADPELNTVAELAKESLAIPPLLTENTTKTTIPIGETQTTEAGSKVPGPPPKDSYVSQVKGIKQLKKTGESFILPSGEACVKIPNSVIEKNRRSWDCFVLGQFYVDPPSQGTIHNIVNGIWSKQYRDIAVSKMEGFAYLFRIPNVGTRNRVINQRLWQIDGKTMFVAKWEPGIVPAKPELSAAPIWLELRKVPLQFFNEDGLERIAGLVGEPKFLHPTTANKTNLEVAKVFTIIDPRKPLPEAVNVQFDSGEISRVLVSSPWMPPICNHCKEIGHLSNRCKLAPITCVPCNSSSHGSHNCPKAKISEGKGRKTRRAKPKEKQWAVVDAKPQANAEQETTSKLGTKSDFATGECSKDPPRQNAITKPRGTLSEASSGVEPDSSDVESSEEEEEGEIMEHEDDFRVAKKKLFSKLKGERGKGLKHA